jgi:hypothetical protein
MHRRDNVQNRADYDNNRFENFFGASQVREIEELLRREGGNARNRQNEDLEGSQRSQM